ncbi:uncharacterized protein LOC142235952 [Haematobia irritans]|uniref:uncharacterized protein LOC142235952 n=1 Tax=Haematobia irritans TaxID=7368 RepID=UPI003F5088CD
MASREKRQTRNHNNQQLSTTTRNYDNDDAMPSNGEQNLGNQVRFHCKCMSVSYPPHSCVRDCAFLLNILRIRPFLFIIDALTHTRTHRLISSMSVCKGLHTYFNSSALIFLTRKKLQFIANNCGRVACGQKQRRTCSPKETFQPLNVLLAHCVCLRNITVHSFSQLPSAHVCSPPSLRSTFLFVVSPAYVVSTPRSPSLAYVGVYTPHFSLLQAPLTLSQLPAHHHFATWAKEFFVYIGNFYWVFFVNSTIMTLDKFIRAADHLTHRDEIKGIWNRLKQIYEKCLVELANGEDDGKETEATRKRETESVKEKYKSSYSTYCRCVSKISELMANLGSSYSASSPNSNSSFNLPPIEINVFHGDFKSWPTFRDMFTAVCIKNSKLSPVEKLFHLTQKTKGEAHEIVSKSPLTDDGFGTAWSNLCARYENKRVLVNEQLKTLFNLSAICSESASSIKGLQRDINACISTLRVHKIDIESWNPIFVFLCSNCLPDSTLTLWEQTLNDKTCIPKWSELDEFLTNRYRTLESVSEIRGSKEQKPSNSRTKGNNNSKQISGKISTFQANISQHTCKLCSNEVHVIRKCPQFLKMNYQQRWTEIKSKGLCANCFASSHTAQRCKSKYSCFKCGKRHNSLLHIDSNNHSQSTSYSNNSQRPRNDPISNPLIPPSSPSNIQSTDSSNGVIQTCFASNSNGVLLGTAMVRILHSGVVYRARALLDSGSEGTLISERLSNMLRLPSRHTSATISGLNNSISAAVQKECCFVLGSESDLNFELFVSALVVPHLSNNLPSRTIDIQRLSDLPPLQLADPKFYESSKIDILLGADVFPSIMLSKNELGICGSLMAQETVFGWILTGPIFTRNNSSCSARVSFFCEISLDKQISRFWEVENIPKKRFLSHEDKICEDLYRKTTRRNEEGRYVVSLPFKESFPEKLCLGSSRLGAMAQFLRNESRLIRNPDLKQEYDKSLIEYVTLNHMSLIDSPSPIQMCYYLPHHAVIKPERTTTKVRVVFNASAPSSNGISLNDVLYTGPVLQNDLTVLILKWQFYKFVLNGDIQKMYRQILVNASHTPFQRILFRENPNNPVQEFELKTVTFGLNCAPYLAIRTIIQLANDVQEKYPLASKILRNSIYVDDALLGAHSIEMAIKSRDELIQALNSAGFHMRNWISNSKKILKGLPTEHLLCADFLEFEDRSSAKTLGVRWNALSDQFYFSTIKFPDTCSYTKREVLSQISKLFDPAGW